MGGGNPRKTREGEGRRVNEALGPTSDANTSANSRPGARMGGRKMQLKANKTDSYADRLLALTTAGGGGIVHANKE